MTCRLPDGRLGPLGHGICLSFQLVDELIELVEIDSRPESERVWNGLRCRVPARRCFFTETSTERPIDHILERQPELARSPLEDAGKIIIDGECGAHERHPGCCKI
jgi:hypothetical protein